MDGNEILLTAPNLSKIKISCDVSCLVIKLQCWVAIVSLPLLASHAEIVFSEVHVSVQDDKEESPSCQFQTAVGRRCFLCIEKHTQCSC